MEYVLLTLQAMTLLIIGWFIKNYFPSYLKEKGKNLATKEDIGGITAEIERTKITYASELERTKNELQGGIERLKADLQQHSEAITKRREVYHEIVKSIGVLTSSRAYTPEQKDKFLDDYSTLWLWAPDEVITAINTILDQMRVLYEKPGSIPQEELKRAYSTFILEMRKDTGYPNTKLQHDSYRFVSF